MEATPTHPARDRHAGTTSMAASGWEAGPCDGAQFSVTEGAKATLTPANVAKREGPPTDERPRQRDGCTWRCSSRGRPPVRSTDAARPRDQTTDRAVLAGPRLDERDQYLRPPLPARRPDSSYDLGARRNHLRVSRLGVRGGVAPSISVPTPGRVATLRSDLSATNLETLGS